MAKQYHYTNSKASMNLYEFVYKDLFDVQITPPEAIANTDEWGVNRILTLDAIQSISGLDVDKHPGVATQSFKGTQRKGVGVIPDDTTLTLKVVFALNLNETNQLYTYRALRAWSDLIYDPLTGAQTLMNTYISKPGITVTAYNKLREVFRKYEIKNVFIGSTIPAMDFDYKSDDVLELSVDFIGNYFTQAYK